MPLARIGIALALAVAARAALGSATRHEGARGPAPAPEASQQQLTYPSSTEDFPNPERGFLRSFSPMCIGTERSPLDATSLSAIRRATTAPQSVTVF
jgi:hypothetical protein